MNPAARQILTQPRLFSAITSRFQLDLRRRLWNLASCIVAVSLVWAPSAQAGNDLVRLAMDFNPTPANGNPTGLMVSNDKLYFVATDGTHGIELWQTDGTNVTRLTDLSYGSVNSFIGAPVEFNGELYFRGSGSANGNVNLELWKYDGSNASLVAEINPGPVGSNPSGLRV